MALNSLGNTPHNNIESVKSDNSMVTNVPGNRNIIKLEEGYSDLSGAMRDAMNDSNESALFESSAKMESKIQPLVCKSSVNESSSLESSSSQSSSQHRKIESSIRTPENGAVDVITKVEETVKCDPAIKRIELKKFQFFESLEAQGIELTYDLLGELLGNKEDVFERVVQLFGIWKEFKKSNDAKREPQGLVKDGDVKRYLHMMYDAGFDIKPYRLRAIGVGVTRAKKLITQFFESASDAKLEAGQSDYPIRCSSPKGSRLFPRNVYVRQDRTSVREKILPIKHENSSNLDEEMQDAPGTSEKRKHAERSLLPRKRQRHPVNLQNSQIIIPVKDFFEHNQHERDSSQPERDSSQHERDSSQHERESFESLMRENSHNLLKQLKTHLESRKKEYQVEEDNSRDICSEKRQLEEEMREKQRIFKAEMRERQRKHEEEMRAQQRRIDVIDIRMKRATEKRETIDRDMEKTQSKIDQITMEYGNPDSFV